MSNIFVWTDDKINELKRLWVRGLSATQVGKEMSITRNAVIGKVHRLGLERWLKPKSQEERDVVRSEQRRKKNEHERLKRKLGERKSNTRRRKKMQKQPKVGPVFEGFIGIPFADLRPFSKHAPNQCRYIPAEPPGPDYLACGSATAEGEAYCEHCKDIVFARPWKFTEQDRQRRVFHMRRVARPATIAGVDIVEDAA
jgi:GcrA cell cycle regulator